LDIGRHYRRTAPWMYLLKFKLLDTNGLSIVGMSLMPFGISIYTQLLTFSTPLYSSYCAAVPVTLLTNTVPNRLQVCALLYRAKDSQSRLERDTFTFMTRLDPAGWEFYCEKCKTFREARVSRQRDISDRRQYFEFVCSTCDSVLLTAQRASASEQFRVQSAN
jgi:hypothetical protein